MAAAKKPAASLPEALFAVQGEITKIVKDGKNPHFNSSYTTLPTLIETINPILQKNGLLLSQVLDNVEGRAALRTVIFHVPSGQQIEGACPFPDGLNAQQMGSAVTYFRRYALQSALGIVSDDDDGNFASAKQATAPASASAPTEALPAAPGGAIGGAVVL